VNLTDREIRRVAHVPSLAPERPDADLPYLVTIHHPSGAVAQLAKAPVSKTGDSRFESWLPRPSHRKIKGL
jgi:hypothetical protein